MSNPGSSRILLLGKNGQVGWELQRCLVSLGEVTAVGRAEVDFADVDALRSCVRRVEPTLVVNAAAYTAVDKAESEADLAAQVNGVAPGVLAEEAKRTGALLVHYSTDYVFDGRSRDPYSEESPTCPLGVYGRTKLAGEEAIRAQAAPHLIFRTSWVYGTRGRNFLLTMARLFREGKALRVVDDQLGSPTWCRWIADATGHILASRILNGDRPVDAFESSSGTYNLSAASETSWHGFAQAIVDRLCEIDGGVSEANRVVTPIPTSEFPTPAERPQFSVLSKACIEAEFGLRVPSWQEQLHLCLGEGL